MIEINLVPGARRSKASARQSVDFGALAKSFSSKFKDKFAIGAAAAVVIALGTVGVLFLSQQRKQTELTARQEKAVRDSTKYANYLKDRYRAEAVRDTLLRQVNIIRSLDEDRYVWPHVMDEIDRALPQYTWLTLVAFTGSPQGSGNVVVTPKTAQDTSGKAKNKPPKRLDTDVPKDQIQLRITGRTVDIEALTRFMKDLEASPFLGNVMLDRSEPAQDNGKEVTQFQLTLNYTRPDTTYVRRVPLTLASLTAGR
ncbi:MAG TPA: PilN domain-containing protein [Gemmatimonadaceae bacterium]|jgi:Tfp pilus assembly protein PilN|nr:PilN domain-containing protein [Gemmatimonadaceae bacterium]